MTPIMTSSGQILRVDKKDSSSMKVNCFDIEGQSESELRCDIKVQASRLSKTLNTSTTETMEQHSTLVWYAITKIMRQYMGEHANDQPLGCFGGFFVRFAASSC